MVPVENQKIIFILFPFSVCLSAVCRNNETPRKNPSHVIFLVVTVFQVVDIKKNYLVKSVYRLTEGTHYEVCKHSNVPQSSRFPRKKERLFLFFPFQNKLLLKLLSKSIYVFNVYLHYTSKYHLFSDNSPDKY